MSDSIQADAEKKSCEETIDVSLLKKHEPESEQTPFPKTRVQTFWLLSKFMLPLVVTMIVPDIAEQALNRGMTSIADDEIISLLASFGLAFYITRFISCGPLELRNVGIVLVRSREDNKKMTILSFIIGLLLTIVQLAISVTPAGVWLLKDVHRQPDEVVEMACLMTAYLSPVSLLESIAYYYEGGLISHKLTLHAGIAKFADFGFQVVFLVFLIFTPSRTEPILVPLFPLYAGMIGRLILSVGFWYVYARRKLPEKSISESSVTYYQGFKFWIPLAVVRAVQTVSRPAINLVVSRTMAVQSTEEDAAKGVAVLTAVYPTGRVIFSWLNDLRAVVPTFHKKTSQHRKIAFKTLGFYSLFCTLAAFTVHSILFIIPGPGLFIMQTVMGLSAELAEMSLVPLQIFAGLSLCVGFRAYMSGVLIKQKRTVFLTPSGVGRLIALVVLLVTMPYSGLNGPILGTTCLLLSFVFEAFFLGLTVLLLKIWPMMTDHCKGK